jgi:hypothetical protein
MEVVHASWFGDGPILVFFGEVLASFLDIGSRWFGPLEHGLVLLV